MRTNGFRAPWALAVVAIVVTIPLAPVSGADSPTDPFYSFHFGGSGQPTWTILKLEVSQPEVRPTVSYQADEARCPMTWGTYFMTGTPGNTRAYNGLIFDWNAGRTGTDTRVETPVIKGRPATILVNDGAASCAWWNPVVTYGELPLGVVYMVQFSAGLRFESVATLTFDRAGVTLLDASWGATSFYANETEFGGMGFVAFSPPFCGGPTEIADCPPDHVNPGGLTGASVGADRWVQTRIKHRPLYLFSEDGTHTLSNASMQMPTGEVRYARANSEVGPFARDGQGIMDFSLTGPTGWYRWTAHQSVAIGTTQKPGWHLAGADVWFPEEQE